MHSLTYDPTDYYSSHLWEYSEAVVFTRIQIYRAMLCFLNLPYRVTVSYTEPPLYTIVNRILYMIQFNIRN